MDKEDIQGYDDFVCNCLHSLESAIECTCFDKKFSEEIRWYLKKRDERIYDSNDIDRSRKLLIDFTSEIIGKERTEDVFSMLKDTGFNPEYKSDRNITCTFMLWELVEKLMEDYLNG